MRLRQLPGPPAFVGAATRIDRPVASIGAAERGPATSGVARRRCGGLGRCAAGSRAPGGSGGSVVVVVVKWLEVVLVEVAGDGGAELDALEVGGPEVDPGPDAGVDVFLQRV